MNRVLEIVLDVVSATPQASSEAAVTSEQIPSEFAVAICAALPQLEPQADSADPVTITVFDSAGVLARAGWRIGVQTRGTAHCVVVSSRRAWTPGIVVVEPIFEAHLEADGLETALFDAAPEVFREALASCGPLEPSATLSAVRSRWRWERDGLSVDLVLDADLRAPQDEGASLHELRVSVPWAEGEDDAPLVDALFACAHELADALPAFVRLGDALERAAAGSLAGDACALRAEPVDLGGACTAEAALVAIGANISAHWLGNDWGVRDSADIEFIHQMRVAQRRLRTVMRIFSHWQDETWDARVKPELSWLGGLLGDARDRDVFVEGTLPALAAADVEPARWRAVLDEAQAQRLVARARLREALASPRYAHAALAWLQWLAALARCVRADGANARSLHRHAKKRVRRYYEQLAQAQKLTAIDDAGRHRVRISAKYLRYTLEFFAPITTRRTRADTTRSLARLQGVLGDGNDAAVALRYLERMDAEPYQLGFARGWCEAMKRYTAKEGERLLRELRQPKVKRGA
ncbi:CHAD domain-containing protein [Paraburkholderia pallida]|uniref:CHAD domain-containing protein n=1 Tax=Paraburkholderia pallida TaxID=2547399 RepID=A0A4P7CRX9_9BURK|nr:CHAD domain-containing protein [Paraburkholderia pallida]QBQ98688.1 CHAD domain-containing protein [Paraburkholderia pallida]